MTGHIIEMVFAWLPLAIFIFLLFVLYFSKRHERAVAVVHGKTYACARCGRRGKHEHMVPVTHEGAVVWYCGNCAARAS